MANRYIDLIDQTFYFPQDGFRVENGYLHFYNVPLKQLIDEHGTPLRLTYLPKIGSQIQRAREWFNNAFKKHDYNGSYFYSYCTKSSHFSFVMDEVLKAGAHIETSSTFDINLVKKLYDKGKLDKNTYIICNGFKRAEYAKNISEMLNSGFKNVVPVLDNLKEIDAYEELTEGEVQLGIRIAAEEEPNFEFYTSRLGIRYKDVIPLYEEKIKNHPRFKLKMLHFFINTGIKDSAYYWSELNKVIQLYCELKRICPELKGFNLGGGFPIRNSLHHEYDYAYMVDEIIQQVKRGCADAGVPEPDIFTEFGSFTVGESGAIIYKILGEKQQNDSERWYMINNSFITTLPDTWGIGERFILLPVNKWENEYQRVNLGGLSCDQDDYYNSEIHVGQVYLPKLDGKEPLYIGLFHVGAYQESLSGYGGIKHCLIPSPKHVLVDENFNTTVFAEEQKPDEMLRILGY